MNIIYEYNEKTGELNIEFVLNKRRFASEPKVKIREQEALEIAKRYLEESKKKYFSIKVLSGNLLNNSTKLSGTWKFFVQKEKVTFEQKKEKTRKKVSLDTSKKKREED